METILAIQNQNQLTVPLTTAAWLTGKVEQGVQVQKERNINQMLSTEPQIISYGSSVMETTGMESLETDIKSTLFRTKTNIKGNKRPKSH